MPLMHGKSKKAFEHNVKTEMDAHPGAEHRAQNLAIAYAMKRKAKKKMADGGSVTEPKPAPVSSEGWSTFQQGMNSAMGGSKPVKKSSGGEIGVNKSEYGAKEGSKEQQGTSEAGFHTRLMNDSSTPRFKAEQHHKARMAHLGTLQEMRSVKNDDRSNLAEGGDVKSLGSIIGYPTGASKAEGGEVCEHCGGKAMFNGGAVAPAYETYSNASAMSEDDKDLNQHDVYAMDSLHDGMVDKIMHQRSKTFENEARFSEGGQVANDTPLTAGFKDNDFDDLVLRDDLDSDYGDDNNSGDETGNDALDERDDDVVSRVMRSRAKKDRMPRPA